MADTTIKDMIFVLKNRRFFHV